MQEENARLQQKAVGINAGTTNASVLFNFFLYNNKNTHTQAQAQAQT